MKESAHRKLHSFGQIPTYEEGELTLFESGVIIFHMAERHTGLLPGRCEPLRLCRAWRSTARLQACFRRSVGGFYWQAADELVTATSTCPNHQ